MFPAWLKVKSSAESRGQVAATLAGLRLNTVCASAECPNLGACFANGTATFLIMGAVCTRACAFCAIGGAKPAAAKSAPSAGPAAADACRIPPPDPTEPARLAEAVKLLGLKFAVITSVTRDDLPDGGASFFADAIRTVRAAAPGIGIEVLTPDFCGDETALAAVLDAAPTVFNHNIETVRRLSAQVRDKATYGRSLALLRAAANYAPLHSPYSIPHSPIYIKSGLMLGLGETVEEIFETLSDLRAAGVSLLTIGQYLPPTKSHHPLARFAAPEEFADWREKALALGFTAVASAPLARSSYHARELATKTNF